MMLPTRSNTPQFLLSAGEETVRSQISILCQECELLLVRDEISRGVREHLAGCPGCRSRAIELQANAHALRALGAGVMPVEQLGLHAAYPWWKWTSAAAALIFTLTAAWWISRPPPAPRIVSIDVKVTGVVPTVPVSGAEPRTEKILTPGRALRK